MGIRLLCATTEVSLKGTCVVVGVGDLLSVEHQHSGKMRPYKMQEFPHC